MDNSYEAIKDRIKGSLRSEASKIEGSFAMDIVNAAAVEYARIIAEKIDPIIDDVMIDTAQGYNLDRAALGFSGAHRNEAQKAVGLVKITGNTGIVINAGAVLISTGGTRFIVKNDALIGPSGVVDADIECEVPGIIGNVPKNEITAFKDALNGVSSVINETETSGGVNRETDEAFRKRVIESKQRPITSGNANHYIFWAKEVPGILNAKVIPLANGNGTVRVIVLSNEYDVVDSVLISNVKKHIENNRPVGAQVEVVSATPKIVNLDLNLVLAGGFEASSVKESIKSLILDYLKDIAFDDTKSLSYYKVGELIFKAPGVNDIAGYTLNGGKESLSIALQEFFKLGEVKVNGS